MRCAVLSNSFYFHFLNIIKTKFIFGTRFIMEALKACGYDEVIECPYNKSHQILKSRMQGHLLKCRKNYPEKEKNVCPFNSTHLINKKEYDYHVENCLDRASFDLYRFKIDSKPYNVPNEGLLENVESEPINNEEVEDWSNDDVPTYNPEKHCRSVPIIRAKVGGTPSEKKAFRNAQRDLFQKLNK